MTVTTAIPTLKDIKETLSGLLDREIEVSAGAPSPSLGGDSNSLVALYVDDNLRSVAVIVADFPLSARVGAAIGLVPAGGADAALEDNVLPANLRENAAEVLNVLAALFNRDGAPHLRLYSVTGPGDQMRSDVKALAVKAAPREDILVDVARYGQGVLSVVLA